MRASFSLIAINVVAAVALMFVIADEWSQPIDPVLPDTQGAGERTPRELKTGAAPQLRMASIDAYGAIVERPLFSRDRRPAPVAPAAEDDRPSAIDKLVLTGIVTGPEKKLAIFAGADRKELRLEQGGVFNGWRLAAFSEEGVSFSREGSTRELPLYKERTADSSVPGGTRPRGALRRYLTRRQRSQNQQP